MKKLIEIFMLENRIQNIPWEWNSSEWWQDSLTFFHGTQIEQLKSISTTGLKAGPGSKGHGVYLALDPFTARAYASMRGGEYRFKKQKEKQSVPMSERAVLVIKIPKDEIDKLITSKKDSRLFDKETWENVGKNNPRYWELAEVVYPTNIPADYIKGYMTKV